MKIAVLCSPNSWYLADLRRAAAERHCLVPATFRRLSSRLDQGACQVCSGDTDLAEADCVLVRAVPPGSLEQVVFRMDALARLEAAGTPVVNPAKAVETAVDKYLASARLQEAGLRVPRTAVCQTVDQAMAVFAQWGGPVVLKPLFGSEGRGLMRLDDESLAYRAFSHLVELRAVLYLQEFIPHHGYDLRLLVIGDRVLGISRHNPADWRTNIARGATARPLSPPEAIADAARTAARAVAAPLAGVDLLPGRDGQLYAIEVNAVPGWKALAEALQVDVAALVLEYLEARVTSAGRILRGTVFPRETTSAR
jgi:ribosomal protein S6--L-glutamate ligase